MTDATEASDQKGREARKKSLDQLEHGINRADDRFSFDDPRFIERYIASEMQFLLHFFAGVRGSRENDVAYLRLLSRLGGSEEGGSQRNKVCHVGVTLFDQHLPHGLPYKDAVVDQNFDQNPTVLIHDVQSMKYPKQRLSTLRGIYLAHGLHDFLPEGFDFSESIGFLRLRVVVNREVDTFPFVGGIVPANENN